jgi:hypothetical protein
MSINITDLKDHKIIDLKETQCKQCPLIERIKRSVDARLDKSRLLYQLNALELAVAQGTTCWILKYFNSPTACPCIDCLLKVCCSEDCAEKIKALRKVKELIKQENNTEARQWGIVGTKNLPKGTKIKDSAVTSSMEEIQESLRARNTKHERETQKYRKRRK